MADFLWLLLAVACGLAGLALFAWGVRVLAHELHTWAWRRSLVAFELRIPRAVTAEDVARWVGLLRSLVPQRRWWSALPRSPLCVETTATHEGIRHVAVIPGWRQTAVLSTLSAAIPGARLVKLTDYLTGCYGPRLQAATEIRLRGGGELLATDRAADTSRHIVAALQPLQPGETIRIQWLFTGVRAPRWITRPAVDADIPDLWQAGPVLGAVGRLAVASPLGRGRAKAVLGRVWAAWGAMNTPQTRVARQWWWPRFTVAARLVLRVVPRGRWPVVATADELAGLLGLAVGIDVLPGVPTEISRTLPPSPSMPPGGLVIARSNYPSTAAQLHLSTSDRLRHTWILGPTGTGKSTLLCNIIGHDIAHGDGLVLIDAGGDLVADVLDRIPDSRADDIVVIDPTHSDHIVGLNPLTAGPPEQAAGFTYHVLRSLWAQSWGPRSADIVRACLLTLTATTAPNGSAFTLIDIPELLTNAGFRRYVTTQSLPPQLMKFWRWYDRMPEPQQASIIAPVLNKLRTFTLSSALRATLGQSDGVQFSDILAKRRVVLVALKKGILGAEACALIGALVMASVWQAAQARVNLPKAHRTPFWLVADEFQETVRLPLDLADMAARARSLGLGLVLAHQYLAQLTTTVKTAVLGTIRTQIVFQLERDDATELAPAFTPLTATDLHHLATFEIAARLCTNGATGPPVTGTTYPAPDPTRDGAALAVVSRQRHGLPLPDVDEQITERATPPTARATTRWNRIPGGEQP
ncbi:MAG: type IV secretion system DNA-binding domain-containing protein [Actinomycetota bacterium]|nr:type IV secretion system DNA-binding domain-containing protein [Actinomycetota bacterium]